MLIRFDTAISCSIKNKTNIMHNFWTTEVHKLILHDDVTLNFFKVHGPFIRIYGA